jgi:hypothetical protein
MKKALAALIALSATNSLIAMDDAPEQSPVSPEAAPALPHDPTRAGTRISDAIPFSTLAMLSNPLDNPNGVPASQLVLTFSYNDEEEDGE